MREVVLSAVQGLATPFVAFIGAEFFEVPGKDSVKEIVAGSIAALVYLAICQFLVTRKGGRGLVGKWPTLVATNVPVLAWVFIIWGAGSRSTALHTFVPILLSGCIGSLAGALVAARGTTSERPPRISQASWRTVLRFGAGLFLAVAAVLAVLVTPAAAKDASPAAAPRVDVMVFLVFVLLHVLLAANILWRTRSSELPVAAGTFGLFLGVLLFGLACIFLARGPAMRLPVIALFACAGGDFLVGGSSLAAALAPFIWLRHSHS